MTSDALTEPFRQPEFEAGLGAGLVALGVVAVLGFVWLLALRRPAPIAGLGVGVAVLVGFDREFGSISDDLVLGLFLLAMAGLLIDVVPRFRWALTPLAVPGALILAGDDRLADLDWVPVVVTVVIVVGGALGAELDRRSRLVAVGPTLVAVSAGGVYATVPDTEHALALLGAALPLAVVGWPVRLARLGGAGAFVSVGALCWVVVVDGRGREGAIVGGLACLGLLALEPLAGRIGRVHRRWPAATWVGPPLLLVLHVAVVLAMSRVAGLRDAATDAVVVVTVVAAAVLAAALVVRLSVWGRSQDHDGAHNPSPA